MVRFHHVNLGVPVGGIDEESAFLLDYLSFRPVEPPARLASRAHWFESEDGTQIHLSEDPEHRPADRAHVAVVLGDDLAALERAFDAAGYEYTAADGDEHRTVLCADPAGNRWELRGALSS
jgi:catechol 2,3-dioxygenase-like lactoylglutathione lyase family enzyme